MRIIFIPTCCSFPTATHRMLHASKGHFNLSVRASHISDRFRKAKKGAHRGTPLAYGQPQLMAIQKHTATMTHLRNRDWPAKKKGVFLHSATPFGAISSRANKKRKYLLLRFDENHHRQRRSLLGSSSTLALTIGYDLVMDDVQHPLWLKKNRGNETPNNCVPHEDHEDVSFAGRNTTTHDLAPNDDQLRRRSLDESKVRGKRTFHVCLGSVPRV